MNGLHAWLWRHAHETAEAAQRRAQHLQEKVLEAEQLKARAEAALQLAQSAVGRLDYFEPVIHRELQCPDCWVARGVHSKLKPVPSDTKDDKFKCESCHQEFSPE
jgi:hypothetical protein